MYDEQPEPPKVPAHIAASIVAASHRLGALKADSVNSHFKSEYISLQTMMAAAKAALKDHNVTVFHSAEFRSESTNHAAQGASQFPHVIVRTILMHDSGEAFMVSVPMPLTQHTPHAAAGAITYGRRIGLGMALGIVVDEDDDGNAVSGLPGGTTFRKSEAAPAASRPPAAPPGATAHTMASGSRPPRPMTSAATPPCPKCGGPLWDNRAENAKRKAAGQRARPAFSCKDKDGCNAAYWDEKDVLPPSPGLGEVEPDVPDANEGDDDLPF